MKFKKLYIFLIFVLIIITACENKENIDENIIANSTNETPTKYELKLTTTNNKQITVVIKNGLLQIKEFPQKIVLLNFWTTWCPSCKAEIPHLINLQNKYKNNLAIVGLIVAKDNSNDMLNSFIKEYQINYPITNSNANFELANIVGGVSSIPAMFLFDKSGKMVMDYAGIVYEEILDNDIKRALSKGI